MLPYGAPFSKIRYDWEVEEWTLKRLLMSYVWIHLLDIWSLYRIYPATLNKRKQNTVVWIVFQPYLFSLQEPKEPQTMEKADCGKFNICQQKALREKSSKKILFIYIETVKGNTLWEAVFPHLQNTRPFISQKSLFFGNNH